MSLGDRQSGGCLELKDAELHGLLDSDEVLWDDLAGIWVDGEGLSTLTRVSWPTSLKEMSWELTHPNAVVERLLGKLDVGEAVLDSNHILPLLNLGQGAPGQEGEDGGLGNVHYGFIASRAGAGEFQKSGWDSEVVLKKMDRERKQKPTWVQHMK